MKFIIQVLAMMMLVSVTVNVNAQGRRIRRLRRKNLKPSASTSEVACQASTFIHPQIFSWKEDETKTKATIVGCGDALEKEIEKFRQKLIQNQNEDIFWK